MDKKKKKKKKKGTLRSDRITSTKIELLILRANFHSSATHFVSVLS
jgi:hypothetical protein